VVSDLHSQASKLGCLKRHLSSLLSFSIKSGFMHFCLYWNLLYNTTCMANLTWEQHVFKEEWEVNLSYKNKNMMWFFQVLIRPGRGGLITTHNNQWQWQLCTCNFLVSILILSKKKKNFYPYCVIINLYLAIKIGRRNHLQACLHVYQQTDKVVPICAIRQW